MNLQSTLERDIAQFGPTRDKQIIRDLRQRVCEQNLLISSLRAEVAAGLPDVDDVDVSDSLDPQDADEVTPDDDIREQIRTELYDMHADFIQARAQELVCAERKQLAAAAAEARADPWGNL